VVITEYLLDGGKPVGQFVLPFEKAESTAVRVLSCEVGVHDQSHLYPQLCDRLLTGNFPRQNSGGFSIDSPLLLQA
jgi:hypothetical protein